MQAATMQHHQQGGVYLGNSVPKVSQHQSVPAAVTASSSGGGVKKWKNKLKTFLNSPLPGPSNSSQSAHSNSTTISTSITSIASPSSSTTASATPRPDSPHADSASASISRPTSPHHFGIVDHQQHASSSTSNAVATAKSTTTSSGSATNYQNDVYAGYDISVNYPNSSQQDTELAGPNDSYEARLSRLVGDLENVDYGSFTSFLGGNSGDILVNSSGNDSTAGNGDVDASDNIRISSSLFNHADQSMNNDIGTFSSNHPFAYASAGTPSHLDSSSGPSGLSTSSKPFSNSFLSNSLNFQNQYPLSSSPSSNGIINIEDAINSFTTPFFTDFSAYTNLDDDLPESSSDIRIPSFESQQSSEGESRTPSSAASLPLSAVHSADSHASGRSTAATSEILPRTESADRQQCSQTGNNGIFLPASTPDFTSLVPQPVIKHSTSMPFAPFQDMSISAPNPAHIKETAKGDKDIAQPNSNDDDDDDDDDDFSSLLRQSQIEAGSGSSHATVGPLLEGDPSSSAFQGQSMPSNSSLSTQAASPLTVANFDLTMFPMPKSTATASVKMGSQPSSGSESSYGPSPSLSYGGSSTSNTSFDDPNANKDNLTFTPKKSKAGKNGKVNPKNLSISLEEPEYDTSSVTVSPGVKTPTHSPHPSITSIPPTPATPASYKTASSNPTSPYRPRPTVHASALAWRVAPSPHSPHSAIPVDTARTIRPMASQTFMHSDPFAAASSPSRLGKLNTASSPELKRRRNAADDDDSGSPSGQSGIESRLATGNDFSPAAYSSQSVGEPASPLRPIAYRRRVGHKFSTPQLAVQVPQRLEQQQQQHSQAAPSLHQRQYSQPLPITNQIPLQYSTPASAGPASTFQNNQQMHARQFTSPLPSPSAAAYNYTQQQQQSSQLNSQQQPPIVGNGSWLSDNIITSLITQLSDGTYMCLMQNCGHRAGQMEELKSHISGHFAPQSVPLQQTQSHHLAYQPQIASQYPTYQQRLQYSQPQQQTWM